LRDNALVWNADPSNPRTGNIYFFTSARPEMNPSA
jgi:hypothetical protein